jgi:hypothetical protein
MANDDSANPTEADIDSIINEDTRSAPVAEEHDDDSRSKEPLDDDSHEPRLLRDPKPAPEDKEHEDAQAKETEAKEPDANSPAKPEGAKVTYKLKINGEERELPHEEVQDLVNRADFAQRSHKRMEEAAEKEREAAKVLEALQVTRESLLYRPGDVLLDVFTAAYGDEERARDAAVDVLERFLMPIYEEREKIRKFGPEYAERVRTERLLGKTRREYETYEAKLRALREEETQAQARRQEESRRLEFENSVVKELSQLGVPNDDITEAIYHKAKALAEKEGFDFTPKVAAGIIRQRREAILGPYKSQNGASPSAEAETPKGSDVEKAKDVRQAKTQGLKPQDKPPSETPGSRESQKRKPVLLDDLRDRIMG